MIKTKLLIILLILSLAIVAPTVAQDQDHDSATIEECTTPTESVTIKAEATGAAFNTTQIKASKGACLKLTFINAATSDQHDFTLERANGSTWVHMHLMNSSMDPFGDGPGKGISYLQMPNEDLTLSYFCSVTGHQAAGMEGTLIIGKGSSSGFLPGFDMLTTFLAISFLLITIPVFQRRRKN